VTLLAEWGFGEGSGSTAADAVGGHTLTLANATWDASGHTGPALTNTAADTGASGTVPAITGAVTLMCWVKPLDLAAGSTHAACGIFQGSGNTDIALFTQRGSFGTSNVLQADIRINGNLSACNGTSALTVGTWTHVAVTYDGTSIKLYRNGVLETTTAVSGTISLGTGFYVAGALAAAGTDSDVVVDDARLYDQALSQPTIATLKDTPVGGTITGTGALTAPPAAAAGAGTVSVTGAGAVTAPAAQGAGTGAVAVASSGALVAPPAAAASTGSTEVAGTGSATAPAASASGTGAVAVTSTGALTAPAAVVAGTGSLTAVIEGNGALIAPSANVAGAAEAVIGGVGALVAPAAVVHGAESATPTRDITITATLLPGRYRAQLLPSRWHVEEAS
jgi:hypothetical protein